MADSDNSLSEPLCLPAPETEAAAHGPCGDQRRAGPHTRRRRPASGLPNREEILAELNALKGALAANWITPAQANAMAKVYQLMLQCLGSGDGKHGGSAELQSTLANLARRDPQAFNALQSFLTDEQFNSIVAEMAAGPADPSSQAS